MFKLAQVTQTHIEVRKISDKNKCAKPQEFIQHDAVTIFFLQLSSDISSIY